MLKKYLLSLVLLAVLVGCGGKPYEYQDANEVKPGPGLFSGDAGELYLIKSKEKENGEEAETGDDGKEKKE